MEVISIHEMIKPIAREWAERDGVEYSTMLDELQGAWIKGHLDDKWVSGCYEAIMSGKHVEFLKDHEGNRMYLAGKSIEQMHDILSKMRTKGFSIIRKQPTGKGE